MKKLVLCLVAATIYLNPLYPVYAIDSNSAINPDDPRILKLKQEEKQRAEKIKMESASKEASLKLKLEKEREKIASRVGEMKEKFASKEAALKAKLAQFKDKVKAERAEKVSMTLQTINSNRTSVMTKHLEILTKTLNTIEDRVNEGAAAGKNVDSAKTAISTARSAIEKASAAVSEQSSKDYAITVSSEETVKSDAKAGRDILLNDLKSTHEMVKQAREAVVAALKAAKEVLGVAATPAASV